MDELLHHCLRELSFDGDLGCNVARLRDFVHDFYTHNSTSHPQNLDDAFHAFVWSLVVQQPTVRVGVKPAGVTAEVWIAPQTSAKRKAKAKGEELVETVAPELDIVPDAKLRSLDDLKAIYGEELRIAVNPDAVFAAISGSHIRSSKLSPMVYSALQIITRGRDGGTTVVELGKQSGYDQKTCFYLVKQLIELDLIVKVRRGGVGTHFCIHKYFFERNASWREIREEALQAQEPVAVLKSDDAEAPPDTSSPDLPNFSPIDSRHLSSFPLVRGRVVKLLTASKNYIHASNNMLITIGFSNPTKTDRRFFQSRIRELLQLGIIEKVLVPSKHKQSPNATVKCFRLITPETVNTSSQDGVVVEAVGEDEKEDNDPSPGETTSIKMNVTINKQILNLLDESGTQGMTLSELSDGLCHFDKRTIELLLSRAEKFPPPAHLSDLGIAGLMETFGRERRHRYLTVAAYRRLVAKENLEKTNASYANVDLSSVGQFATLDPALFYQEERALHNYQDSFEEESKPRVKKQGRPRKQKGEPLEDTVESISTKAQTKKRKKPEQLDSSEQPPTKKRRGVPEANDQEIGPSEVSATVTPKKRGRPRKNPEINPNEGVPAPASTVPKKRGRPPKNKDDSTQIDSTIISMPKKRGRPPKQHNKTPSIIQEPDTADERRISKRLRPANGLDNPDVSRSRSNSSERLSSDAAMDLDLDLDPLHVDSGMRSGLSSRASSVTRDQRAEPLSAVDVIEPADDVNVVIPNTQILDNSGTGQTRKSRVNVSHLRRENEFYRILVEAGGILSVLTNEFANAHMQLVESMSKAGESTSTPLKTSLDKRTIKLTINAMEARGRIKCTTASVTNATGTTKPAHIIYLPEVEPERLASFLMSLGRPQPVSVAQTEDVRKISERLEYGADVSLPPRGALPLQLLQLEQPSGDAKERWSKNATRATQLFQYDDTTIRNVLLTERTTVGQLYGFIVPRLSRAREFHLSAVKIFSSNTVSPNIVSLEKRIINLQYFYQDFSVADYLSLVSSLAHNDAVNSLMSTEEGRQTAVRDLDAPIHTLLQVGRSRGRTRVLDTLEILQGLYLVTPLKPSTSDSPLVTCAPLDDHPTAFEKAADSGWTNTTPQLAPVYWQFHENAPLHHWAVSESSPPFWKHMNVSLPSEAAEYWSQLKDASSNMEDMKKFSPIGEIPASVFSPSLAVARSIRRSASWNTDYIQTWHQTQYLKKFTDPLTAKTPLDAEGGDALIKKVCWVSSVPENVVRKFYADMHGEMSRELAKARSRKSKQATKPKPDKNAAVTVAPKVETANQWEDMVHRVHPLPLSGPAAIRVRQIQQRFFKAGSTGETDWEAQIRDAIQTTVPVRQSAATALKVPPAVPSQSSSTVHHAAPPIVFNPPEKSLTELIEKQGRPLPPKPERVKRARRKPGEEKVVEPPKVKTNPIIASRRVRFNWTREYEELARDAAAIIRARCRSKLRLEWMALEQVFPAVPRNSVRQRLISMTETPGTETYMNRLEDRWYDLWIQHRGTDILPDADVASATNFNLAKHIEFLRKHIDKNALRVGFSEPQINDGIVLPNSVADIFAHFDVEESPIAPPWDFLWTNSVEENREKFLYRQAFTAGLPPSPPIAIHTAESVNLTETALKMVMGTPNEAYDPQTASILLRNLGDKPVANATKNLIGRGVLSKIQRDHTKPRPGRTMKICEINQNALGGSISSDTFQDSATLEDISSQQQDTWREWPLLATDGDTATLIQLVSDNKVDFNIDSSHTRAIRDSLEWNSKKADDDQMETSIQVKFFNLTGEPNLPDSTNENVVASVDTEVEIDSLEHGKNAEGSSASCSQFMEGPVDCSSCLSKELARFCLPFSEDQRTCAHQIISLLRAAGPRGLSKDELLADIELSLDEVLPLVSGMTTAVVPLLFWTGYNSLVLVSSEYLSHWSVMISDSPTAKLLPRRWLDISGVRMDDVWLAALRATVGVVIFRPGISLSELRWRLRAVYDRCELLDVVRHLQQTGLLVARDPNGEACKFLEMQNEEEIFCSVSDVKHWYQIQIG